MSEILIESNRLFLLTPKIKVLEKRLSVNNFYDKISIKDHSETILYPSDWPGDALEIYPFEIERRKNKPDVLPFWTYNIIDKKAKLVVGDICCKAEPDKNNELEIGYGINLSQHNKGYATEAVAMLTSYLFKYTTVLSVIAECNIENISSIKVLEKNGFNRTNSRFDLKDGNLIVWKKFK